MGVIIGPRRLTRPHRALAPSAVTSYPARMNRQSTNGHIYLTEYAEGTASYGAYLEAEDLPHARALSIQRGLNERILGEALDPALPHKLLDLIETEQWIEAAHEACFLGFVGITSGMLSARDILGDQGLVHELLHLALKYEPSDEETDENHPLMREELKMRLWMQACQLEMRVPGWVPSVQCDTPPEPESTLLQRVARFLGRRGSTSA